MGVCHYRPCRVDIQNSVDCRFFVNAGWLCKTPGEPGPVIWRRPLCRRSGGPQGRVILSLGRNLTDIVVPLQIQPEGCGNSQHSFKRIGKFRRYGSGPFYDIQKGTFGFSNLRGEFLERQFYLGKFLLKNLAWMHRPFGLEVLVVLVHNAKIIKKHW